MRETCFFVVWMGIWVGLWIVEQVLFPASNGAIGGTIGFYWRDHGVAYYWRRQVEIGLRAKGK